MHDWIVLDSLVPIVLNNVKGCIVEIGLGNSTLILSKYAKNFGRKHYACDIKGRVCDWVKSKIDYNNLIINNCDSLSFLRNFNDIPAIIFIDGNHRYNIVKQEVDLLLPKLSIGGMGFFHDTYLCKRWIDRYTKKRKYSDTYKIRQDLENNNSLWCMTFPYTAAWCGLTVILKKDVNRLKEQI